MVGFTKTPPLIQMELSLAAKWNLEKDKKDGDCQEEIIPLKSTKKMEKKAALKYIEKTNSKMTKWLVKKTASVVISSQEEEMIWEDDLSIPQAQNVKTIERREEARLKQEAWKVKRMCQELVEQVVDGVEGAPCGMDIMSSIVDKAWWEYKVGVVWSWVPSSRKLPGGMKGC